MREVHNYRPRSSMMSILSGLGLELAGMLRVCLLKGGLVVCVRSFFHERLRMLALFVGRWRFSH